MLEKIKWNNFKIMFYVISLLIFLICIGVFACMAIDRVSFPTNEVKEEFILTKYDFNNNNVFTIQPKGGKKNNINILYFHGGSYVGVMTKEHWDFLADICKKTECNIIIPDYPVTPKYSYKDVFSMIVPLYQKILEKVEPDNLIVMGDSAGGGIGLALLEEMEKREISQPGKTILISPWLDVTLSNPKIDDVAKKDPVLNKFALKVAGICYSRGDNNDFINPINGPIKNLKNITIYTGTNDLLNPDIEQFYERTKQEGLQITIKQREGANHIWILEKDNEKTLYAKEDYENLLKELKEYIISIKEMESIE